MPNCKSWNDLERNLSKQGIGLRFKYKGNTGIREGVKFTKGNYTFSGSKIDQGFSFSKLDAHFNRVQKQDAPKYFPQAKNNLQTAVGGYLSIFGKCFSGSGKGNSAHLNLTAFGAGCIPLPLTDLGIGISAAQLQRQSDETPEQHIARITALINSMAEAMLTLATERKRKQENQIKRPKVKF